MLLLYCHNYNKSSIVGSLVSNKIQGMFSNTRLKKSTPIHNTNVVVLGLDGVVTNAIDPAKRMQLCQNSQDS